MACWKSSLLCVIGFCTWMFGATTPLPGADGWRAGVAKVVITPERPMPMAGYASRGAKHAEGKLTELWAKALVIQDGAGSRGVLVTIDLVGIERKLSEAICEALQNRYGFERQQIVLACSHTHTGPVVAKNLRPMHYQLFDEADRKLVDDYATVLESKIVQVVGAAVDSLAPAELSWGQGTAGFAVNRRNNPEKEVPARREQNALQGPFDHDVPVLTVRRADQLAAIVFGYACHCTVLSSMQWSGDYAGFAQQELEAAHPGTIAMFWAGCGADQNPLPRREEELARQYGHELAASVEAVLTQPLAKIDPGLATSYAEIPLKFGDLPTREMLQSDSQSSNQYVAARAKSLLAKLDAGTPLSSIYPYPVTYWRLGRQVDWFFLGGEVTVEYALRTKAELGGDAAPAPGVWVTAYAQDVMAYIPSRKVLFEGGYEGGGAMVYYGLPTAWSADVEEQILTEIHRQAKAAR